MKKSSYFEDTKELINPTMHKYIYALMKYIIFGKKVKTITKENLKKFVDLIKKNYKIELQIGFESSDNNWNIDNLKKIITLIKKQSFALSSEIIENIFIRLLSLPFNNKLSEFFGKYIYNNLRFLRKDKYLFDQWMNKNLLDNLFIGENISLERLLEYDQYASSHSDNQNSHPSKYNVIYQSTFITFLRLLKRNRFIVNSYEGNKKSDMSSDDTKTTNVDGQDMTSNYLNESCNYYSKFIGQIEKDTILPFGVSTFISSYICYQNRKSSLMKFSEEKENLVKLPFIYELSEAAINDFYLEIILRPIRFEPRISVIRMNKNNFGKEGILELHKDIIFNKNIKEISIKSCGIKSKYLKSFEKDLRLFDNKSIENLDMSSNYIKSDADKYLAKLISMLKGLKTFTLSFNILKSGLAAFFVTLKNLYRQKKTKLETLILNKCRLDDLSFYELGEMLKCKYCKLKCLCLSLNDIPSNVKFFEALKKNRSLKEIYLYGCGIKNDSADNIDRIISNSNLESLYLYVNKIHDFNQYIRIIYRNILIKTEEEEKNENIICDFPCLYNLNMNEADCYNRNSEKIKLFREGIKKTNLSILDLTSMLYGFEIKSDESIKYYNEIEILKNDLESQFDDYKKVLIEILNNKVDKEKLEKNISESNKTEIEKLKGIKDIIEDIINDPNSKYEVFIKKKAKEIKSNLSFKERKEKKIDMAQLIDYIKLKRVEKILSEKEKIKQNKKMILI